MGRTMSREMKSLGLVGLLLLTALSAAQSGWSRYRLLVRTPAEAQRLADSRLGLFSEEIVIGATDVIVGPGQGAELWMVGLPFSRISALPAANAWAGQAGQGDGDYRSQYLTMDGLMSHYEALRAQYPEMISRRQIGVSRNGEAIWAYLIFAQAEQEVPVPPKNVVLIGGTHAREWISPSVTMHIATYLAETLAVAETAFSTKFVDKIGVWVIPDVNPDGYRFSWTNNRYWRKNRRNNGGGSYGVDLNRNYAKGWGGAGSSSNPSSDTYRGPSAFSEPELTGLRDLSLSLPNVIASIDFHSYGQKILWPWSYTTSPPPDASWLNQVGTAMRSEILLHGLLAYQQGQASTTLYVASGTSKDWFYDVFGTPSFTIELRDTGQYGFLLPENQIAPTQEEGWWAFVGLINKIVP